MMNRCRGNMKEREGRLFFVYYAPFVCYVSQGQLSLMRRGEKIKGK